MAKPNPTCFAQVRFTIGFTQNAYLVGKSVGNPAFEVNKKHVFLWVSPSINSPNSVRNPPWNRWSGVKNRRHKLKLYSMSHRTRYPPQKNNKSIIWTIGSNMFKHVQNLVLQDHDLSKVSMVFLGFPVVFLWFSCGFPMVFPWLMININSNWRLFVKTLKSTQGFRHG